MSTETQRWQAAGDVDDIPVRGARRFIHEGEAIALFRTRDDAIFALADQCPHQGGPLSQGIVHDGCVTCPLHNWVIALDSGEAQGADQGCVKRYPTRLEGRTIMLQLDRTSSPAHDAANIPETKLALCQRDREPVT